ncbi:MAG: DUF167 domain-containing protein [Planctomycetes bacterium]|nr:DUF167 domain-containing protein [Planctomycetota bacterium]
MISLTDTAEGVIFSVKVVPGSSRTRCAGEMGSMLKVNVAAVPEKGKANECLTEYLAGLLGIRKNAITILSGRTSPAKQIRAAGITADTLQQILSSAARKKK